MLWKSLAAASLVTLVVGAASAKGNFQAQGIVSEVRKDGEELIFRYVGSLSLDYATAPAGNPKRQWKSLKLDVADVVVRIGRWTREHEPSKRAQMPDTDAVFQKLSRLAMPGRKVVLSIDNPTFKFSNLGELIAIDGTYVYAVESPS